MHICTPHANPPPANLHPKSADQKSRNLDPSDPSRATTQRPNASNSSMYPSARKMENSKNQPEYPNSYLAAEPYEMTSATRKEKLSYNQPTRERRESKDPKIHTQDSVRSTTEGSSTRIPIPRYRDLPALPFASTTDEPRQFPRCITLILSFARLVPKDKEDTLDKCRFEVYTPKSVHNNVTTIGKEHTNAALSYGA